MSDDRLLAPGLSQRQRRLLELMQQEKTREDAPAPGSIPKRDPAEPALLSFAQQRLWFIQQFQAGTAAYNIPSGVRVRGPLAPALFTASLRATARRHETLRTTFALVEGVPIQRIAPPSAAETIPLLDLAALPADRAEREAQRVVNGLARQPFDLESAPPWRAVLVRLAAHDHVFLVVMHHIISDTWTTGVFFREMVAHYRALVEGRRSPQAPLPVQYADYAQWQRRQLQETELRRQIDYWRRQFEGAPALLELPCDRPRPAVPSFRGGRVTLLLPNALGDRLKALTLEGNATLFMILMASYQLLLARTTGQDDILVGTPMANRTRVELESLIGVFVNTLVLRTRFSGRANFRELLAQVRATTLEGLAHHDVPFERVVEGLGLERDTSRNPLFQALFAFQNVPIPKLVAEGLTLERFEFQETTARLDLELDLQQMPYGFVGWIGYSTDLFEAVTAERLTRNFLILLAGIAEAPQCPLQDLPLLAPAERAQLLTAWNDTATPYVTETAIHRLFERQVERVPEALAVVTGAQSLTYRELNRRANQLAHHLWQLGVVPGATVAVHLERAADNAVALLGILKAGAAYVPLDVAWPAARLDTILGLAGAAHLVTHRSRLAAVAGLTAMLDHVICLDLGAEDEAAAATAPDGRRVWGEHHLAAQPGGNLGLTVDASSLAYVIFTSGSTGVPKGVMVQHRPVINLIEWVNHTFAVGPGDRLLLVSALTFDLSVYDLFGILAAGGTVRIASEPEVRDGQALARVLCSEPITFWDSAPAALQQLIPFLPAEPVAGAPLRLVFQSGDWIPVTLPDRLRTVFPGARVIGLGGATEATVWSNWFPIAEVPGEWTSIPYGRPIQNARYHVLAANLEPVPTGVAGDLYIGGECLAAGYLGDPALTSRKFLPDPFASHGSPAAEGGARLYATGDRARYWGDGNLEFLGRRDHQVKVRGYRIELGEVEATLARHPGVREVAVAVRGPEVAGGDGAGAAGGKRLVAYVVAQPETSFNVSEMRAYLQQSLPDYMVPSAFVPLESLPVTTNGKLDRNALPAPGGERPQLQATFAEVQGELELRIAEVWRQVLQVEKVGRHDNFFELGGHSMLLAQVHRELQTATPELTLVDLFTYSTVATLAAHLSGKAGERSAVEDAAVRATARRGAAATTAGSDIAIIGMALRFPGAGTPERFWENLENGVESISFFSREEVLAAGVAPELVDNPDYVRAEGDIPDVDLFDPEFFGLRNLAEVELLDPQQRIFLECAWEALERAGYDPETYGGDIGVFGGVNISSYLFSSLYDYDPLNVMSSFLTRIGLLVGNQNDYLCTRVSYHLNLRGPSVTVQSACSTATVAAHLACQSLLRHECDMCLAGGAQIRVPQRMGYLYQEGGFPSPDGHCRSFDARAQGNVHGNGAGVLLLKRLADALRDGDHIHAVIKGSAAANDGSAKVGFTAPGIHGQAKVAAEALAMAGVSADSISYLEATGTATELGDPLEIAALTSAYRLGTQRRGYCPIGSVKSNIGHLDAASGVAAVIKTALALEREKIPPSLHLERPNPRIDFAASPFFVNAELRPWPRDGEPRRAAVHTYAVGGTNTHIILEEAPPSAPAGASRDWQLLPLSARTSTALHAATENLAFYLREASAPLPDVAHTLQVGRREFAFRRVALCRDREDAALSLTRLDPERVWSSQAAPEAPAVAFLCAGDGTAFAAAAALYTSEPTFREEVNRCSEILTPLLGLDLAAELRCAAASAGPPRGPAVTEPLRFVIGYALARLWIEWGVEPRAVLGAGVGEYVAACLAEALSLEDALTLAAARGRLLSALPAGARLAVWASPDGLQAALGGRLTFEAQLEPEVCLVRGTEAEVERWQEQLNELGVDCLHLGPAAAVPAMLAFGDGSEGAAPAGWQEALSAFAQTAARVAVRPPRIAWFSSLSGAPVDAAAVAAPGYWHEQIAGMARLDRALGALLREPGRVLLSLGPAGSLGESAARLARTAGRLALLSLPEEDETEDGVERLPPPARLLAGLGRLWLAGVKVAWNGFYRHEQRRRVPLPTYPFERRRIWAEPQIDRATALGRPASADRRLALDQWFYAPSWQRSEQPGALEPGEGGPQSWLLLSDGRGLGERLARRLRARGVSVVTVFPGERFVAGEGEYRVDPRRAEDFTVLVRELRSAGGVPQRVVHLWGVDAGEVPEEAVSGEGGLAVLSRLQEICFWGLCHLVRALGEAHSAEISVVTAGAQEVTGEEELRPSQAASLALAKVIPREYPHLRCRTIDVEWPGAGEGRLEALSASLAAELARGAAGVAGEWVVALRGRQRWVQRFARLSVPEGGEVLALRRPQGVYLIAGVLRGHGLLVATCLAQPGARLVLVGDSGLPAPETWDDWLADPGRDGTVTAAIAELRRLEALGCELLLCEADLANREQVRVAVERAYARFGTIHGVFYVPGDQGPELTRDLARLDPDFYEYRLRLRLEGLAALEEAVRGRGVELFLLGAGLASVLGGPGLALESLADSYLDLVARRESRRGSALWRSVDGDIFAAAPALTLPEGVEALARVLAVGGAGELPQIVVSTSELQARQESAMQAGKPGAERAGEAEGATRVRERPQISTPYLAPRTEAERRVAEIWAEVLGLEAVGLRDDFFDLGGSSLVATQLVARLRGAFGVSLALQDFFTGSNVEAVAERVSLASWALSGLPATSGPTGEPATAAVEEELGFI